MHSHTGPLHGRGSSENPRNRFRTIHAAADPSIDAKVPYDPEFDDPAPRTTLTADHSKTIVSENDSPDVPFAKSINPYRGCEHGCAYCYARPTHEYLGLSAGLDFETKLFVKYDAAALLREAFASPRWQPELLGVSGVTDAYQPVERKLQITRACLEVCNAFKNPVCIVTKSDLVVRDADLLAEMASVNAAGVCISVTTLDTDLARRLEPRACVPSRRVAAIARLAARGIPTGVLVAPVIPGLNDHEIPAILESAANAGAAFAGYVVLRLPHGLKDLFTDWLDAHAPDAKAKILHRVSEMRGGKLNDTKFGARMRGEGPIASNIADLFRVACARNGFAARAPKLSAAAFARPRATRGQLGLFDGADY
ncbi:MAG: PA0069 family radical SAM protein [Planctomycetes bacterium]|nr:PA0069 family radical SAM protein [Planctomycetota bacterium]